MWKKIVALLLLLFFLYILGLLISNNGVYAHSKPIGYLGCDEYQPRGSRNIPDFTHKKWDLIEKFRTKNFIYKFYRDTERPELQVAAMTVSVERAILGTSRTTTLTRTTWQENNNIFSIRNKISENICQRSIFGADGNVYPLSGLFSMLRQEFKKAP